MADPITISLAAAAAGGLVKAGGDLYSGQAQKGMYQYQAGISQIKAKIDKENQEFALHRGEVAAIQRGEKGRAQIGQATVAQASKGFDVRSGSNVAVRDSIAQITGQDVGIIREGAAHEARGFEYQTAFDKNQANLYRMAGEAAETEGEIKAAGSLLGTAESVSGKWAWAKELGTAT